MTCQCTSTRSERGSAFFVVVLLVVASVTLVGAFLSTALGRVRDVELMVEENSAWNAILPRIQAERARARARAGNGR